MFTIVRCQCLNHKEVNVVFYLIIIHWQSKEVDLYHQFHLFGMKIKLVIMFDIL